MTELYDKTITIEISKSTLELAQLVAELPAPATDKQSIEEWAKRLAADISKGSD